MKKIKDKHLVNLKIRSSLRDSIRLRASKENISIKEFCENKLFKSDNRDETVSSPSNIGELLASICFVLENTEQKEIQDLISFDANKDASVLFKFLCELKGKDKEKIVEASFNKMKYVDFKIKRFSDDDVIHFLFSFYKKLSQLKSC